MVEVCVLVTSGTLEREATVTLTSVNDEAVGKRKASANCVWCQLMTSNFGWTFVFLRRQSFFPPQHLETMMLLPKF